MVKANKGIKCKDRNYAIYKIGNWKNDYKINVIGTSTEIPITSPTKHHVELNMEQIRSSSFEFNGKEVNGMVGLAIQLNPSLIDENIGFIIWFMKDITSLQSLPMILPASTILPK